MIKKILASLAIIFMCAFSLTWALYSDAHRLIFWLGLASGIFLFYQYWRQEKSSEEHNKDTKEIKKIVEKIASNIQKQPELDQLNGIAKSKRKTVDELLAELAKGSQFDRGLAAIVEQKYDEAIQLFEKNASDKKDEAAESLYYLGNAFCFKADYQKATEAYQRSIDLKPNMVTVWNNWGVALENLGRYEEAIKKYQEAIKYKPYYAEVFLTNWGNVLGKMGRLEEAVEKYQEATRYRPEDADAWHNWGVALKKLGRGKEAEERFKKARELSKGN